MPPCRRRPTTSHVTASSIFRKLLLLTSLTRHVKSLCSTVNANMDTSRISFRANAPALNQCRKSPCSSRVITTRIYEVQITIKPTKYNTYMQSKIYQELMDLHLGGMAEQWEAIQMLRKKQDVSLNDGIQMLIQAEKERRSASKAVRLIKHAKFRYNATIEEVVFDSARGKDKDRILHLASCEYVRQGADVLITGPSGSAKASSLRHSAIRHALPDTRSSISICISCLRKYNWHAWKAQSQSSLRRWLTLTC